MSRLKPTKKYRYFNHHHELTDDHEFVDFGDGEFIANKKAIPILKALAEIGLRTRTHHIDKKGGFFSVIIDPKVSVTVRQVNELDSTRTKYNGLTEVLFYFSSKDESKQE